MKLDEALVLRVMDHMLLAKQETMVGRVLISAQMEKSILHGDSGSSGRYCVQRILRVWNCVPSAMIALSRIN